MENEQNTFYVFMFMLMLVNENILNETYLKTRKLML